MPKGLIVILSCLININVLAWRSMRWASSPSHHTTLYGHTVGLADKLIFSGRFAHKKKTKVRCIVRRKIDHEDKLDVPMFFGFVGFFTFGNCAYLPLETPHILYA